MANMKPSSRLRPPVLPPSPAPLLHPALPQPGPAQEFFLSKHHQKLLNAIFAGFKSIFYEITGISELISTLILRVSTADSPTHQYVMTTE